MPVQPSPKYAVLFPGQGSQAVGMGMALADAFPEAAEVLAAADEVVPGLGRLMREGPEEELRRTSNAQPALLAASLACWAVWRRRAPADPAAMAGHSLGEYSALAAAGALELRDALRLVRTRGELMDQAVPAGRGSMAAVLGLADEVVEAVCREASRAVGGDVPAVVPANFNAPGQVVVSGSVEGLAQVQARVKARGGRFMPLSVSGPFHSPFMAPAAARFETALRETPFSAPRVEVFANVTAAPHPSSPDRIRELLQAQLTAPVRWVETVQALAGLGVTHFVELGPGRVLSGLVRRILGDGVVAVSAGDPDTLEQAVRTLGKDGTA